MAGPQDPPVRRRARLGPRMVLLSVVVIDFIGFAMIIPLLPFFVKTMGGRADIVGYLVAAYSLAAFLGGPIWGWLSDKLGRKPVIVITLLGVASGHVLFAQADTLVLLFAARLLSGFMAGNVSVGMAMMADLSTPADRAKSMGWLGAATAVGFSIGPGIAAIASGTADNPNFALPGYMAASLSGLACLAALIFLPNAPKTHGASPTPAKKTDWAALLLNRNALGLLAVVVISYFAQGGVSAIIGFWSEAKLGWDQRQLGGMMMAMGFAIAIVQSAGVGPMVVRFGELGGFALAMAASILSCLVIILFSTVTLSVVLIVLGYVVLFCGLTLAYPFLMAIQSKRADADNQGAALGLTTGASAMGRVIGPVVAGLLFEAQGPSAPFYLFAALCAVAMLWAITERRRAPV